MNENEGKQLSTGVRLGIIFSMMSFLASYSSNYFWYLETTISENINLVSHFTGISAFILFLVCTWLLIEVAKKYESK